MVQVSAKTWEKSSIRMRIIKNEENKLEIWLNRHDIQHRLGVKSISDMTIKEIEGLYNKKRKNITRQEKEEYKAWADDGFVYILSDLALKIIKGYKGSEKKAFNFRSNLGFKQHDVILSREQSVTPKIMKTFSNEKNIITTT